MQPPGSVLFNMFKKFKLNLNLIKSFFFKEIFIRLFNLGPLFYLKQRDPFFVHLLQIVIL